MAALSGRFVGVGVGSYTSDAYRNRGLAHAVRDVEELRALIGADLVGDPLVDPSEPDAREYVKAVQGALPEGGVLVFVWSGHGNGDGARGLRLLTSDSSFPADGLGLAEVAGACAASGASQLLFIIDTCFAGQGLVEAGVVAAAVLEQVPPAQRRVWVGVLASCQASETAKDGVFGQRLRRVLAEGPEGQDAAHLRRRWTVHNQFLRGDDVCDALVKGWDSEVQRPAFLGRGSAWWMFRNPLYEPGAPEQVVEHLLLAARGGEVRDERSWFTGRRAEVDRVVSWVACGQPGIRVVTGGPGTGKSAIVGRVVSASNPQERARLLDDGTGLGHSDPGVRSVHAHVHARALTVERVAELLDGQLVGEQAGVLESAGNRRNAAELIGALQRRRELGVSVPVLVVDGLDEAREAAFPIARELLLRLAPYAVVIVSTRNTPEPGGEAGGTLVDVLEPTEVLDLDEPEKQMSGTAALREYVVRRLAGVSERMDPEAVAELLTGGGDAAGGVDRPFLLARVLTDRLRSVPVDTALPGWASLVAGSIDAALDADLALVAAPAHMALPEGVSAAEVARVLLTALTWGFGAGLPEPEWVVVAGVLLGREVSEYDVDWVLDQMGRYVVQDGEGGVAVYRMAHQSLADHLRPRFAASIEEPFDPEASVVASSLLRRYAGLLGDGLSADTPTYLWRYAWRHCAVSGPHGLGQLRALAETDAALTPYVALAALETAAIFEFWGRHAESVAPTEEAVGIYRTLAEQNPAYLPDLASALDDLGGSYASVGRRMEAVEPAEEAARLHRAAAEHNPAYLPDLASTLTNLGIRYGEVGRRAESVAPTEEAVEIYRTLAKQDPSYSPNLALVLSNLGAHYGGTGRRREAVEPAEESVEIYLALAKQDRPYVPQIASALLNLGNSYSGVGRPIDAVPPTEHAVRLRRTLAEQNPAYRPDLAAALNNLGGCYIDVGRDADAMAPHQEAVELYRALAEQNPGYLPDLAAALDNLGGSFRGTGRHSDAVTPTEEAVELYRALAEQNPGYLPDLAMALNNLANRRSGVGQRVEAVEPAEEAAQLYRNISTRSPAHLSDLAMTLNNLSSHNSAVGRHTEAVQLAEEAMKLYRHLSEQNPAYLPGLAGALTNLGNRRRQLGESSEGMAPTEEAVAIYRDLAEQNPAYLPSLASVLDDLGACYGDNDQPIKAVELAEQAVELYRELVKQNPAHVLELAAALNNLSVAYTGAGQHVEAVELAEEAVTLRRTLAQQNPANLRNLALALNNLGGCYGRRGRDADAVQPTEEAVELYRELVKQNPAYLPELANALNNLDIRYNQVGEQNRGARCWQQSVRALGGSSAAILLAYRARYAEAGHKPAAGWLVQALALSGDDREAMDAIHSTARRHRGPDPAVWDRWWLEASGLDTPAWMRVDGELLAVAESWLETPTFEQERDHLAAHPRLLDEDATAAVSEALLAIPAEEAERYTALRASAQRDGVDAAYRPLLSRVLADRFAHADLHEQQTLLLDRRAELLSDAVLEAFHEVRQDGDLAIHRALALLQLAAEPESDMLRAAFEALDEPERFPPLLDAAAFAGDATTCDALAILALSVANSPQAASAALMSMAIAAAVREQTEDAEGFLDQARQLDPTQRDAWIAQLAAIASHHPQVLGLITQLATPHPPDTDR